MLKEELGDVLLQVAMHAEIESEQGTFDINDVCDGICKKLIIRHPHVFGDVNADTTEKVLKNWDFVFNCGFKLFTFLKKLIKRTVYIFQVKADLSGLLLDFCTAHE